MRCIIPGRSIETVYLRTPCATNAEPLEAPGLVATSLQACENLRKAQVHCYSEGEDDSAQMLPAFAHDTLREFHLFVAIEAEPFSRADENGRLSTSSVMQALPPGALTSFPRLEFLQIVLMHQYFPQYSKADIGDLNAVVEALRVFLMSESHAALNRVEIGLRSRQNA